MLEFLLEAEWIIQLIPFLISILICWTALYFIARLRGGVVLMTDVGQRLKHASEIPSEAGSRIVAVMKFFCQSETEMLKTLRRVHIHQAEQHAKFGRIYREAFPGAPIVCIADPDLIRELRRQEDRCPIRITRAYFPWYSDRINNRNSSFGLLVSQDQDWIKMRKLTKSFLRTSTQPRTVKMVNTITRDFINSLSNSAISSQSTTTSPLGPHTSATTTGISGELPYIENLVDQIFRWSFTCSNYALLGYRLDKSEAIKISELDKFGVNCEIVLETLIQLSTLPEFIAKRLFAENYRKQTQAWDEIYSFAKKSIELARMNENERTSSNESRVEYIVQRVLSSSENGNESIPTESELLSLIVDLQVASADSTKHALEWCLYFLGQDLEVQEKVRDEAEKCFTNENHIELAEEEGGTGDPVTIGKLSKMVYVTAVLKESLRLYPIVAPYSRVLRKPAVLGGYRLPTNSLISVATYAMNRDASVYDEPDKFVPERWIKNTGDEGLPPLKAAAASEPFAFGHGSRDCVGKQFSMMQMKILISMLCHRYVIRTINEEPVKSYYRSTIVPETPIKIHLQLRAAAA